MESSEILSKNLKKYRESHRDKDNKKMSQEELAQKTGISTRSYGKIERGEVYTSLDIVDMLSAATGLSVSQLLDDKLDLSKENNEE